jgi:cellobiose phosphorylase
MHIAMMHYILGVRPTLEGLEIKPCLPDTVTAATVKRMFRGKTYQIELSNRDGKQSYVCKP